MSLETEVAALTKATTDLLEAVNVAKTTLDAAKDIAVVAQGQAQNYLGQTQTARDQALSGLGAADNSQILSELLGSITYAIDIAGITAREMPSLAALFPAIDAINDYLIAIADLAGVTARSIAGGDVLLGPGLVGAPSLAAMGDRNTGIYFPGLDQVAIATGGVQRLLVDSSGNHASGTDNLQSMGTAARRWSTVYAGTGTINTSDAREKTPVNALTDDEKEFSVALSKEIGTYQFLESIAAKGDAARHHIGLTVQRAIDIAEDIGINPFRFGFICFDEWPEIVVEHPAIEATEAELDEDGNVTNQGSPGQDAWIEVVQEAGNRYAFRYDQLALFIAAGFEARLTALEAF